MDVFAVVVPAKPLSQAKSRLAGVLSATERARLAAAMLRDTLDAVSRSPLVSRVTVVGSSVDVEKIACEHGALYESEQRNDLNDSLTDACDRIRQANPGTALGIVHADVPAVQPHELEAVMTFTATTATPVFIADRHGIGTTALFIPGGHAVHPLFGPNSAAAFHADGARPFLGPVPGLRHDVDTPADLDEIGGLDVGAFTRDVTRKAPLFRRVTHW
ncbi:2-phospho-L-lactate guanylyltransferase [Hoyosella rhizosphaerae]|uniref:2-phospho-L-lactate guanylyltransferase n=1 Tax=Hoyosella rhizosphaerae TaxID=1755582 RepID=UPI001667AE81|nr:2-phospho-L-lactate guanylyltransferase [Hoyosella rhizosphaerae]MBN4927326.1 2-phospho-L-lactate guanylyltransferase [Hoyosella rhizosphaerae]